MQVYPLHSALAGLLANAEKAAVAAHNIANANTPGFKKSTATVETTAGGQPGVKVTQSDTPGDIIPAPEGLPDTEQFVEMSNVNWVEEFIQMKLAQHGYTANASLVQTQDQMVGTILDILV